MMLETTFSSSRLRLPDTPTSGCEHRVIVAKLTKEIIINKDVCFGSGIRIREGKNDPQK
jgi:hypothetical protein